MRTLVIGAAIVDLMMRIDRLPHSGEDIPCKESKTVIGGCAFNVANTLQNLECEHDLCVPVGNGPFADLIRKGMAEKGYTPLIEEPSEDNGYCLSLVEADGERTFITVQGAEGHFQRKWFDAIDLTQYGAVYLAGYQSCGESGRILTDWLENAAGNGICPELFFAPGPMITKIEPETMERFLSLHPVLHINEMEAKNYTGCSQIEDTASILFQKTQNTVIITLGAKGTLFCEKETEIRSLPAVPARVVDTVGAGDSHIGAVIAGLSKGLELPAAITLANRVAAAIVQTEGPVMDHETFRTLFSDIK